MTEHLSQQKTSRTSSKDGKKHGLNGTSDQALQSAPVSEHTEIDKDSQHGSKFLTSGVTKPTTFQNDQDHSNNPLGTLPPSPRADSAAAGKGALSPTSCCPLWELADTQGKAETLTSPNFFTPSHANQNQRPRWICNPFIFKILKFKKYKYFSKPNFLEKQLNYFQSFFQVPFIEAGSVAQQVKLPPVNLAFYMACQLTSWLLHFQSSNLVVTQ